MTDDPNPRSLWRENLHEIIFEADTPLGKLFDVGLLVSIIASVLAAILESVNVIRIEYGTLLRIIEWYFTIAFTIEYVLRLVCVRRPLRYAFSFFGIVDLLAIVPTYLSLVVTGTHSLIVIRAFRLLRVFRVFKLAHFVGEAETLRRAMRASMRKIVVFLGTVVTCVVILGTAMYLIEGERAGFSNIPEAIYWSIVTMTTVGYGDVVPETVVGKMLSSVIMVVGYGIIAVPTGIVTVEMAFAARASTNTQACKACGGEDHDDDAKHCKWCGAKL